MIGVGMVGILGKKVGRYAEQSELCVYVGRYAKQKDWCR